MGADDGFLGPGLRETEAALSTAAELARKNRLGKEPAEHDRCLTVKRDRVRRAGVALREANRSARTMPS
ncbi:MAG: hypothetical protein NVS4B3_15240 [Gemmatimonadaceae bacterium]